ncbi:hypothetical protein AOLI_G00021580 [Acnodon oligacanthus]
MGRLSRMKACQTQQNQAINHRPTMEAVCVAGPGQTGAIKGSHGTRASVVLTPASPRAVAGLGPQLSPSRLIPAGGGESRAEASLSAQA